MAQRIASILVLGALLLAGAGCGDNDTSDVTVLPHATARLDDARWLGDPIDLDRLTVWPVYTDRPLDLGEFLTLEEAEARGTARVKEVGGEGGQTGQTVLIEEVLETGNDLPGEEDLPVEEPLSEPQQEAPPPQQGGAPPSDEEDLSQVGQVVQLRGGSGPTVGTLVIENDGDIPILVVAGTIVKGGQQDRQIAQDLVIAAHSKVPVEAFCVEPGRWSTRPGEDAALFEQRGLGVAIKSVREKAQYDKDQNEVWEEVREVLQKKGIQSTSTFVAAVEEEDAVVREQREEIERRLLERFEALAQDETKPVGFAYAVNGEIQSVRAFAHARLLEDHLPAFAKAMALEAELAEGGELQDVTAQDVAAFVKALSEAPETIEDTAALNRLGVRINKYGFNGNCYLETMGQPAQAVTADWTRKAGAETPKSPEPEESR